MSNLPYWATAQTGMVTPLAVGNPGIGKTASVRAFARACGRQCAVLVGSLREATDIGGFPYAAERNGIAYMAMMPPKYAVDCTTGKWVLFIDELTSCPEPVQTALLAVVQEGRIGDLELPPDVWRLAACNPVDMASNGHELAPPMVTRLCHLTWQPDLESFSAGLAAGIVARNGDGWESAFPSPSFPILPEDWHDRLPAVGAKVLGYHKAYPQSIDRTPAKDDPEARDKASRPYPCMRSWTNATICRAAVEACDGTAGDVYDAMAGCIGPEETAQFHQWESSLDLPDPEEVLTGAVGDREAGRPVCFTPPARADKAIVLLSGIVQRAMVACEGNAPATFNRWAAGVALMDRARQFTPEVVSAVAPVLIQRKPAGAEIPVDFAEFLYRVLKGIGKLGL